MESAQEKKNFQVKSSMIRSKPLPRLSLGLHIMPKTETGNFRTWLILGLAIFVLIAVSILLIISTQ